jgi:RNA polymerase sigma-70 factor (ECF subfamily)
MPGVVFSAMMAVAMTTPDLAAIAADLAKDLDAGFPAYVRATADGIFSGSLRMLGDRHDAEDIMQETYGRAYRALAEYDVERIRSLRVAGWTWTIAANLCRNRLRSRARKPATSLDRAPAVADTADVAAEALSGLDTDLRAALLGLPFPQRAGVVLRHVLDLDYEQIATALDRPVGTVKADVHRGLARLRSQIATQETS